MASPFIALRVRPANDAERDEDWVLLERWLLAEWPTDKDEPVKYWLSNLPAETPIVTLVRLAKLRWRVEHDYRELKECLGLDHYEGRTFCGLHHHLTCVTVAHAFLTCCRLTRGDPDTTVLAPIDLENTAEVAWPLNNPSATTSLPSPSSRPSPNRTSPNYSNRSTGGLDEA